MATVPSIGRAQTAPLRLAPEAADATHELYERYGKQIYRFCLRELGNHEEAEDAAQTTFLNAFRGLDRGVAPEFESAWVYTIAHRVCVSRKRSSFRRGRVESTDDFDAIQELVPSPSPEVDELFGLRNALEALPEQQRRALLLREWQGLSCKEIAAELGLSPTAVEMLLFRARRGIVEELTAATPPRRRGVRARLRASGDMGSMIAAVKTVFFMGGTKIAATLATVAATSVAATTPATRHEIAHFIAPPADRVVPKTKPAPIASVPVSSPVSPVPHRRRRRGQGADAGAGAACAPRVRRDAAPVSTSVRNGSQAQKAPARQAPRPVGSVATSSAQPPAAQPGWSAAAPPDGAAAPSAGGPDTNPATAPDPTPTPTPATATAPTTADQTAPTPTAAPTAVTTAPKPQKHAAATAPVATVTAAVGPTMGGLSPVAGTVGTTVTVTGAHLTGATSVKFNGVSAQFGADRDSQLKAKVPDAATSGPITVTTPAGTASSTGSFTVIAPLPAGPPKAPVTAVPSIGGLSPVSGTVGTWVTIGGSRLTGTSSVKFAGVPASFTVNSDSQISARVPDGATTGPVTVTTANGTATSSSGFTVVVPAPSVSSLSPSSGLAGATVTISGWHLTGATAVTFNGVPATSPSRTPSSLRRCRPRRRAARSE